MTITSVNGFPVYAVTSKEVPCEPSYFQKHALTWVEGAKRDKLSQEEIQDLKRRYHSRNLSEEETVALFGELVEAGIMSTSTARDIYCGAIPIDTSNYDPSKNQGVLTKCDDSFDFGGGLSGAFGGLGRMLGVGGMDAYRNMYEYAKRTTDVDVESSRYFQEYKQFLEVIDKL